MFCICFHLSGNYYLFLRVDLNIELVMLLMKQTSCIWGVGLLLLK